ncbi:amino acid-binding ACT domain-containing protein [Galbibacter marinus]|uniref:Amino acid-binding ACT domain-containing protein n=1 Tax=Galbibacter marinus TaxID=555500 RepID=K2Q6A9_9FLAO|nr:amino acid-binding ACT domain-containing protein [Galbibacter marinus]EKF56356.1 amino acid-binding ACT domain-containing protein [Galbibacter marinus]
MKDLEILLENKVGQLARLGKLLGENNISLEGGGVFTVGDICIAHFLVENANKAKFTLQSNGIKVLGINGVLILKLRQDIPGQLGRFCSELAEAKVQILHQYSDHQNQLILVVDKPLVGKKIADQWMKTWWGGQEYSI